jgi:hypothetical protein
MTNYNLKHWSFIFNCTAGILNSHQLYKNYIKPYAYRYRVRSSISTSIESCSMCKSSRSIRNLTKPSFKTEREENIMSQIKWQNYTAVAHVRVTDRWFQIHLYITPHMWSKSHPLVHAAHLGSHGYRRARVVRDITTRVSTVSLFMNMLGMWVMSHKVSMVIKFPCLWSNSASHWVIHQFLQLQYSLVGMCSASMVSSGTYNSITRWMVYNIWN